MYKITTTEYGLHVFMGGIYENNEIKDYILEKESIISKIDIPFSLLVDLRTAYPPSAEDATLLKESHVRLVENRQFERQVIVITSPVLKGNAQQVMYSSDLYKTTRIIDANHIENWEELALGWVSSAIEPIQAQYAG